MNKQAFKTCFKASFKHSDAFLVSWIEHFNIDKSMPSVVAYLAQLNLRGVKWYDNI